MRNVYVRVPFSVTGTGLTDLVIVRRGAVSTSTVSDTVIGVIPPPVMTAAFVYSAPDAIGAYSLTAASYTTVTLPPAGTLIPVTVSGGPGVTAGVGCAVPLT